MGNCSGAVCGVQTRVIQRFDIRNAIATRVVETFQASTEAVFTVHHAAGHYAFVRLITLFTNPFRLQAEINLIHKMVTSSALTQISVINLDTFCMISAIHALLWHLTLHSVLSTNFALSVVYRDDVWCFAAD